MSHPLKPNLKTELTPILFIVLISIFSLYFYNHFPQSVAVHWNIRGRADGFASRSFAAFLPPLFNLIIYLLLLFIPYFDPQRSNYSKFRGAYHIVKAALLFFLSLVYIFMGYNALGCNLPAHIFIPLSVGFFFILLGFYLKDIKPNWFLGIRLPWTLSSDDVWMRTHRYGSKIFIVNGLIIVLVTFFPQSFIYFMFLFVILTLSIVIYAYLIYKNRLN